MPPRKTQKSKKLQEEIEDGISEEGVTLPIHWNIPKEIPTLHATNLLVQHTKDEFVVMFFEIRPPIILDPAQARTYLEAEGKLEAECLARIAITPARMAEILEVLQENYEKFKSKQDGEKE